MGNFLRGIGCIVVGAVAGFFVGHEVGKSSRYIENLDRERRAAYEKEVDMHRQKLNHERERENSAWAHKFTEAHFRDGYYMTSYGTVSKVKE